MKMKLSDDTLVCNFLHGHIYLEINYCKTLLLSGLTLLCSRNNRYNKPEGIFIRIVSYQLHHSARRTRKLFLNGFEKNSIMRLVHMSALLWGMLMEVLLIKTKTLIVLMLDLLAEWQASVICLWSSALVQFTRECQSMRQVSSKLSCWLRNVCTDIVSKEILLIPPMLYSTLSCTYGGTSLKKESSSGVSDNGKRINWRLKRQRNLSGWHRRCTSSLKWIPSNQGLNEYNDVSTSKTLLGDFLLQFCGTSRVSWVT